MTQLYSNTISFFNRLLNIGITNALDFKRKRTIRILNLICLLGGTASLVFLFINIVSGNYILATLNLITLFAEMSLLVGNYFNKYQEGNFLMSLLASIVFSISSILFNNNMEYYLLLIIGLNLILTDNLKTILFFSIINTTAFILIYQYGHKHNFYPPVSDVRRYINIILWIIFFIIFLQYFKTQNIEYQKEIETKNELLEIQQEMLVDQKIQLENNNEELLKLNQTKEKLFSIIAHDLRLPIGSLKSVLMLFNNQVIDKDDFTKLTQELSIQVDALHNNLDNLLHWSHSQLSGIHASPEKISLSPVLSQTIALLNGNLKQKQLTIQQYVGDSIVVFADVNHLTLILRNLISNAIKYSHSGDSIEVSAQIKNQQQVSITITDYGVGMDAALTKSLFSPIAVQSLTGTKNEKGTGLGLSLCKEFAEKNNGSISVTSTPGKGSSFTILLPAG